MPITCDDCGKEANYKDMPEGMHWSKWMSDLSRESECVVAVPYQDGVILCICFSCLQERLVEITTPASQPNPQEQVGSTSAAKP